MNKYKITTLSMGAAQAVMVAAYDIISAIHSGAANPQEIIKIELIGSTEVIDTTEM